MSVWEASIVNGRLDQGEVLWTGRGSEIAGGNGRLFRQKYADFIAMVHPEDSKTVHQVQQAAVDAYSEYQVEFRIKRSDTLFYWLCIKAGVQTVESGAAARTLGILWDITEQKRLHENLLLAIEAAKMALWESDIKSGNVYWSGQGARLLGRDTKPFVSSFDDFVSFIHPQDRGRIWQSFQNAIQFQRHYQIEYRILWRDQSVHWIEAKGEVYADAYGQPDRILGTLADITSKKETEIALAEQRDLAQITLQSIADAVITTDRLGAVLQLNRAAEELLGWPREAAAGKPIEEVLRLMSEKTGEALENHVAQCLSTGRAVAIPADTLLVARDGRHIAVTDSLAPIYAHDGTVLGTVFVLHDVSHERQLQRELSWQASHDALTGLINRREFEVQLGEALANAKVSDAVHVVLFLDLDQFKVVNDLCGHGAGDELLRQLASVLQSLMRGSDTLARLGGDELAVLLRNCSLVTARYFSDRLRQAVKEFHFFWNNQRFEISVSIGLATVTAQSLSITEIMACADRACYLAKEQGRDRVHVFEANDMLLVQRHREMQWIARLNQALKKNNFKLCVQPIMNLADGTCSHAEVLVRMLGEDSELIPPGAFIPAAERYNLMPAIDRWVIAACFDYMSDSQTKCGTGKTRGQTQLPFCLSINLSGVSLNDDDLVPFISEQLQRHAIDPVHICFEITETAAIRNFPKAKTFVKEIKEMGCLFSLDDFGTGLSSFSYLKNFPVDYLKIDGSFIKQLSRDDVDRAIVASINEIGHTMGIRTVAEFVEDDSTLEILRTIGIDFAQGLAVGEAKILDWQK
jgi:diguanylate cyclase (GGDEF)-like protein/PAS domain S-box-containing protein